MSATQNTCTYIIIYTNVRTNAKTTAAAAPAPTLTILVTSLAIVKNTVNKKRITRARSVYEREL